MLFVCPDETFAIFLHKHLLQVLEEEVELEIDFYLTTKDKIENPQLESELWQMVEEGED